MSERQPKNVLLFLDRVLEEPDLNVSEAAQKYIQKRGHDVTLFSRTHDLPYILPGIDWKNIDVAVVHSDAGYNNPNAERDRVNSVGLVRRMHEKNPRIRVIIASGIYPQGREKTVKAIFEADAYTDYLSLFTPWMLAVIEKGQVTEEEQQLRGNHVEEPPLDLI